MVFSWVLSQLRSRYKVTNRSDTSVVAYLLDAGAFCSRGERGIRFLSSVNYGGYFVRGKTASAEEAWESGDGELHGGG